MSSTQKLVAICAVMCITGATLLDMHIYCTGTAFILLGIAGLFLGPLLAEMM